MIVGLHYQIRHGLLLECFTGLEQSGGEITPSVGIYYVTPMSRGWKVMAYRYADVDDEMDHSQFWESFVCRKLARHWATKVAQPFNRLSKRLAEHPHGFPRGRVACHGAKYDVFHGSDIQKSWGVSRGIVETIFGIKGQAKWVEDDHEHCLMADKESLREALLLEGDWSAV